MLNIRTFCAALAMAVAFSGISGAQSAFTTPTIDLGVVVTDIEKSVKFYTEGLGFKELPGFKVPAGFAADAGLTDGKELDIKVLVLGEGAGATKLKLMQIKGANPAQSKQEVIESQTGFRYLTLMVADTTASVERASKAGFKPIAKGTLAIPQDIAPGQYLTIYKDPDGNFVELVGPKK
jgi:catechol 2,3-dioxygenase-like lactoylglutathione lyase family enzyme